MSNLVNLLVYVLPTVIGLITGHNGTETYTWWCKLTNYLGNLLLALPIMTLCLASVDRYHSTSRSARQRERSSIKIAKISILSAVLASLLLAIPELLYRGIDNSYGVPMCTKISPVYNLYLTYVIDPLYIFLPIILLLIFGILTYRNIRSAQHLSRTNTVNTVNVTTTAFNASNIGSVSNNNDNTNISPHQRPKPKKIVTNKQRIDRQFSTILILEILYFSITTVPIAIQLIYSTATQSQVKSDMSQTIEGLFSAITYVISCAPFSSSFYIYYLWSSTYRQNVKKLLCKTKPMRIGPTNTMQLV